MTFVNVIAYTVSVANLRHYFSVMHLPPSRLWPRLRIVYYIWRVTKFYLQLQLQLQIYAPNMVHICETILSVIYVAYNYVIYFACILNIINVSFIIYLTFRLPTFFVTRTTKGGSYDPPPLQLPATIFFIAHMHITGSPHLAHHTETSFEIIYANFIRQHIMIWGGGHMTPPPCVCWV